MTDPLSGEPLGVPLDRNRVEAALRRAETALSVAKHHEKQAKAQRLKAESLARTWGFELPEDE